MAYMPAVRGAFSEDTGLLARRVCSGSVPLLFFGALVFHYLSLFRLALTPIFGAAGAYLFLLEATRMMEREVVLGALFEPVTSGGSEPDASSGLTSVKAAPAYPIGAVTTEAGLLSLVGDWDRLSEAGEQPSPLMTFDWFRAWENRSGRRRRKVSKDMISEALRSHMLFFSVWTTWKDEAACSLRKRNDGRS
jgi:hypothetical protein